MARHETAVRIFAVMLGTPPALAPWGGGYRIYTPDSYRLGFARVGRAGDGYGAFDDAQLRADIAGLLETEPVVLVQDGPGDTLRIVRRT